MNGNYAGDKCYRMRFSPGLDLEEMIAVKILVTNYQSNGAHFVVRTFVSGRLPARVSQQNFFAGYNIGAAINLYGVSPPGRPGNLTLFAEEGVVTLKGNFPGLCLYYINIYPLNGSDSCK